MQPKIPCVGYLLCVSVSMYVYVSVCVFMALVCYVGKLWTLVELVPWLAACGTGQDRRMGRGLRLALL